jgi:hypothetical protein
MQLSKEFYMFGFTNKAKVLEVAVEYHAPNWIVLIRNAGEIEWSALRDPETKIIIQDEFGKEVRSRPAIKAFGTFDLANAWVDENLKSAERVGMRKHNEIDNFKKGLQKDNDIAKFPAGYATTY